MRFQKKLFYSSHRKVEVWRFADPILGPRMFPSCEKPNEGKIQIPRETKFKVDLEGQKVMIDGNIDVGSNLLYRVIE